MGAITRVAFYLTVTGDVAVAVVVPVLLALDDFFPSAPAVVVVAVIVVVSVVLVTVAVAFLVSSVGPRRERTDRLGHLLLLLKFQDVQRGKSPTSRGGFHWTAHGRRSRRLRASLHYTACRHWR